jgi:hypothetical protein
MKFSVIHGSDQATSRPPTPVDHFKCCPRCGDKELIRVDPDVVCSSCDWDSTAWHVDQGGMDSLRAAAREFEAGAKRSKIRPLPRRDQDGLDLGHAMFFSKAKEPEAK